MTGTVILTLVGPVKCGTLPDKILSCFGIRTIYIFRYETPVPASHLTPIMEADCGGGQQAPRLEEDVGANISGIRWI